MIKVEPYTLPLSGDRRIEINIGGGVIHSLTIEEAIELRTKLEIVIQKEREHGNAKRVEKIERSG